MTYRAVHRNNLRFLARFFSEGTNQNQTPNTTSSSSGVKADVPGLSNAVIHPASQAVGPGVEPNKSGAYKVPEYFCYDNMSFFEAEIEMSKFRLPQPSAVKNHLNQWCPTDCTCQDLFSNLEDILLNTTTKNRYLSLCK